MGSLQRQEEEEFITLVKKISAIYQHISNLPSLTPSMDVNTLFTELVTTCIPPSTVDITKLTKEDQAMRSSLIRLCGTAEGLLERHYSTLLSAFDSPLEHLTLFPYYSNYLKLSHLEHTILAQHTLSAPARVAFVGSGPLPLTSIVLARHYMPASTFDNYDIDPIANSMALRLISSDADLSGRMSFHTTNIMDVTNDRLNDYDVVFLAALVGMDKEEKVSVIEHLASHMAPGAMLMLRSAAGARAFLYPVVDPCDLDGGFEVLSVFHPTDEVINSVVIARKREVSMKKDGVCGGDGGVGTNGIILPCKCCSRIKEGFNHGMIMEELVLEEQAS